MAREGAEALFRLDGHNVLSSCLGKRSFLNDNAFQRLTLALVAFAFASVREEGHFELGSDCERERFVHAVKVV